MVQSQLREASKDVHGTRCVQKLIHVEALLDSHPAVPTPRHGQSDPRRPLSLRRGALLRREREPRDQVLSEEHARGAAPAPARRGGGALHRGGRRRVLSRADQQGNVRLLDHPEVHRDRRRGQRRPPLRHHRGERARLDARPLRELRHPSSADGRCAV